MNGSIQEAAERIAAGEVVAYPTETFYGLAVDPANSSAVEKLLDLKDRSLNQGIPLIGGSREAVDVLVQDADSDAAKRRAALQQSFWPGPLTVVFAVNSRAEGLLDKGVLGPNDTLAVRVSSLDIARELAAAAPHGLITSTSANPKAEPPSAFAAQVREYFPELYVLEADSKETQAELPSTLVLVTEWPFRVLREGAVPASALQDWL